MSGTDAATRAPSTARREAAAFAELFAASGLAFAQPVFDVLGKNSEIFVSRHATPAQTIAFVVAVLFGPPIAWYALELASSLVGDRVRRVVHLVGLGIAGALASLQLAKQVTELGPVPLVVIGVLGGIALALLVARFSVVRTWLRVLVVAPVAFAVLFLVASPVTTVVFEGRGAAAADVTVERPHRLVWIVFDEFPETSLLDGSGHVDAALFPNFAKLAATSNWYRNAATIAPFTLVAVPGMLTGNVPEGSETPAVVANYRDNAFTLLGRTYDVNAYETLTDVCPRSICDDPRHVAPKSRSLGGLATDGLGLWRDFASPTRKPPGLDVLRGELALDPDPVGTARRFVASLTPSTRPRFDFLHVLLPHWPWHTVGTTQDTGERTNPPGLVADRWSDDWAATIGRQDHLLQVQATDALLGEVMDKLQAVGAWDDTTLVVTADHGVGFAGGEPARGIGATNAPDVVWTPLFVKRAGQTTPVVDDRLARTTDILPTVAELLGVKVPWTTTGRSLLGTPRDDTTIGVVHWDIDAAPAKGRYTRVDPAAGLAAVLGARAAVPGDPALRIYRVGPYGGLVGVPRSDVARRPGGSTRFVVANPQHFTAVQPAAPVAPWLRVSGTAAPARAGVDVAVIVNGTVGAVTRTMVTAPGGPATWWARVPPQLFRPGGNQVEVREIGGSPAAPVLLDPPG